MDTPDVRFSLRNSVEASILGEILEEDGVPHLIHSNQDRAYGGLWQFQQGWGFVEIPARYASGVEALIELIRSNGEVALADQEEPDEPSGHARQG